MDSLSYSFKKLLFSKREAPKANGRTGRERFRQSGQRDRRATSPFEEVDLEQYAKTKADLENDVELCSENQNENDIDPWSVDNGEDARRQRDYSGFEEIGVEIELYCGENEKDGLICGESESDQGVKDQKLETGGSSSNKPDYQSDLPGDFLKNDSKDSKDGSDHQNMDNTTSDNIEEVNQGLGETSEISDGIPVLSDVLKEELDSSEVNIRPKAERHKPLTREQFLTYFDSDGRMVVEHDVRRSIFKGGVEDDIRQEVWQFLFELYPCNSTKREREILKTENLIRYEALKARWKPLLQEIAKDAKVGFKFCPDWFGKKIQMAPSDAQDVAENQDSTFVRIDSKDEDYDENNEIEIKLNNSREESVNFVCDGESIRTMGPKAVDEHHDNPFLDSESEDDLEHDLNGDSEVRRDRKPDSNLENMIGSEVVKKRNNNPFLDSDSDDDARHDPHPDYELRTDQNPDYDLRQDQNLDHDVKRDQHSDSNGANNNPFLDSCDAEDSNETKSSQSDSSHEQTFDDDRLVFDSKEKDEQEIEEAIQEAMFDENYGYHGVVPVSAVMKTRYVESNSADEENDFCYIDTNYTEAEENECKLGFNRKSDVVSDKVIAQKESSLFTSGFKFQEREIRPESRDSTIEDESLQQELSNTEFREEEPVIKESDTREFCVAQDDHDRDLLLNNRSADSENLLLNTSVNEFQETDSALQELADFTFNTSTLQSQLPANDEDLSNQNLMEFSSNLLVFQEEPQHLEESDINSENPNFSNAEVDLSSLQQEVGVSTREDIEVSELFDNSVSAFPLRNSNLSTDEEVMTGLEDKGLVHVSVAVVSQEIEKSDIIVEKIDKELYQTNYFDADNEHDSGRSHTEIDRGERSEARVNDNDKDERSEVNVDQLITVETRSEVTLAEISLVNSEISDLRTAGVDFKNEYANDMNPSIVEEDSGNVFPGFDANLRRDSNPDNLDSESNLIAEISDGYDKEPVMDLFETKSVGKLKEDFRSVDQESSRITSDIDNGSIVDRDALNLDLNSSVKKDIQNNTSYMPPWLAQQIKASSPAGTKISKTLHIHAEGLSLVEEDTSHVVPLREITEKASLAVKQQLTESRPPVRSSTPVFSDYPEDNEDEGTGEKDVGDGCTEAIEKEAESNDDVMGGSQEFAAKESDELDGPGVFACDVSLITDIYESEAAANQNEATQNRVLTRKISKDDSSIVRNPQLLSRGLRKAQSVSNITDFTIIENSIAQIQKSITASDQKISKSESHISRPDSRNYTSPLPDIIEDGHSNCPYCGSDYQEPVQIPDGFGEDWRRSIEIQAKVYAGRQSYNIQDVCKALRIIDKDVPRTDRELPYFSGNDNINLLKLRDALISYSFFHPDVGYAQGMNDIMSRFFVVMDSEADAYWMFCNYMEHFKGDFMEKDMLRKINLVEQLLMKMDRELYDFLQELQMELIFCHRWLLLSFKREFSYEDGLRIFEIMSSRHLEVSSIEAEMERSRERARELEKDEGSRMEEIYVMPEYSFDVFLCVAMLHECRDALMETDDMASIYQTIASLPQINDLNVILSKAEDLFYQYCRKSTLDCFQLIDEPIHRTPSWKQRLHLDF